MSNANMLVLTLASLCCTQAMAAVVGGGSILQRNIYATPGVFPAGFNPYVWVGGDAGKTAVLTNNATSLGLPAGTTVDYAGSDSMLSVSELATYKAAHQSPGVATSSPDNWGPLIQVPSAATLVAVPYKKFGVSNLDLSSSQLCGIFAGTIKDWREISSASGPITVVFNHTKSSNTEIFTRHLNSYCNEKIGVSGSFPDAVRIGIATLKFISTSSESEIDRIIASTEGSIGYAGLPYLYIDSNYSFARVNGNLPVVSDLSAMFNHQLPPIAFDRADPANWVPVIPRTSSGYSIVGYTNLIFSQCYKDAADTIAVRNFINRHYNSVASLNNDAAIIAQKLIPLTPQWKVAIRDTFWGTSSSLAVGNTTACNSIGRPL